MHVHGVENAWSEGEDHVQPSIPNKPHWCECCSRVFSVEVAS